MAWYHDSVNDKYCHVRSCNYPVTIKIPTVLATIGVCDKHFASRKHFLV